MCWKQLCAKYVLRHLNLFKEMLNTNKDFLSKRLNMAKRKIQVIIFYSFDCTTDERNLDETYVDRDLIGKIKRFHFIMKRKLQRIKNRGITRWNPSHCVNFENILYTTKYKYTNLRFYVGKYKNCMKFWNFTRKVKV